MAAGQSPYLKSLEEGLDIRNMDPTFRKKQEVEHGVTETEDEEKFWKDQMQGKRVSYCDGFVDKKWISQMRRKKQDLTSNLRREKKSKEEVEATHSRVKDTSNEESDDEDNTEKEQGRDEDYIELEEESENPKASKKGRG